MQAKEGRTDMTKLIVTFRSFANAPKIHAYVEREIIAVCSENQTEKSLWAESRIF
jgi:hypothetical protein